MHLSLLTIVLLAISAVVTSEEKNEFNSRLLKHLNTEDVVVVPARNPAKNDIDQEAAPQGEKKLKSEPNGLKSPDEASNSDFKGREKRSPGYGGGVSCDPCSGGGRGGHAPGGGGSGGGGSGSWSSSSSTSSATSGSWGGGSGGSGKGGYGRK